MEGYAGIPANFPIIVNDDMAIIDPAFAWLHMLATVPGRSHSPETVRTYGEHLHDWFDTLEQSGLEWRAVTETEIALWRNRMLGGPSPHTRRPYARSTINDRVRTVCRFYSWAHHRGWIGALPFHFTDVRVGLGRQSFLGHLNPRPGIMSANVLMVAQYERLPHALRVDQLRRLFVYLDTPYRLMGEWALATGMRRKELCGLEGYQIPETAHLEADESAQLRNDACAGWLSVEKRGYLPAPTAAVSAPRPCTRSSPPLGSTTSTHKHDWPMFSPALLISRSSGSPNYFPGNGNPGRLPLLKPLKPRPSAKGYTSKPRSAPSSTTIITDDTMKALAT